VWRWIDERPGDLILVFLVQGSPPATRASLKRLSQPPGRLRRNCVGKLISLVGQVEKISQLNQLVGAELLVPPVDPYGCQSVEALVAVMPADDTHNQVSAPHRLTAPAGGVVRAFVESALRDGRLWIRFGRSGRAGVTRR